MDNRLNGCCIGRNTIVQRIEDQRALELKIRERFEIYVCGCFSLQMPLYMHEFIFIPFKLAYTCHSSGKLIHKTCAAKGFDMQDMCYRSGMDTLRGSALAQASSCVLCVSRLRSCISMYVFMCVCVCVCMYVRTYVRMYVYMYLHICSLCTSPLCVHAHVHIRERS